MDYKRNANWRTSFEGDEEMIAFGHTDMFIYMRRLVGVCGVAKKSREIFEKLY